MSLNTNQTINLEITICDVLRGLINSQDTIKHESQFNCTQVKFAEYESKIMEIRNIFKNQERVIEELMLKILNIKIENEEVGEVA